QRVLVFLADDVHAQLDAFIADEYRRAGNKLADLMLALAAKRAVKRILFLGHPVLSTRLARCSLPCRADFSPITPSLRQGPGGYGNPKPNLSMLAAARSRLD